MPGQESMRRTTALKGEVGSYGDGAGDAHAVKDVL